MLVTRDKALRYLRKALKDPLADFREGQWESIDDLVNYHKKLLVVQRTGWGKSLIYFIGTRLLRDQGGGPALLISPLISLMRDQVQMANRIDIRARAVNSDNSEEEREKIYDELARGEVDILLITPERLADEDFRSDYLQPLLDRYGLSMFIVDEAHCISDWGHDFRPDYKRIVQVVKVLEDSVPILATTATANNRVVNDIVAQLGNDIKIYRGPLVRESLLLQTIELPDYAARLAWLADHLPKMLGSGIVYTLTKKDAEIVADWLQSQGLNIQAYHSDKKEEREELEKALLDNKLKALVSTVALGMGFDKPDLGFVVHFQRPASVVHYYQQIGRAGRALERAYVVLLHGAEDEQITDYFIRTAYPPQAHLEEVLEVLERVDEGCTLWELQKSVNLKKQALKKALKILEVETPSPVQAYKEGKEEAKVYRRTPVLYEYDHERVEQLKQQRYKEQEQMQKYMETDQCLMQFIIQELDDETATACGKCANCIGEDIISRSYSARTLERAHSFLKGLEIKFVLKKGIPKGALTQSSIQHLRKEFRAEGGRALSYWGHPELGELVKQGKKSGSFSNRLVQASTDLIRNKWQPIPFPEWITCVPSRKHPDLVPNFAARLAKRLGIPFAPCVRKVRDNEPQKEMQNKYHRVLNLDGVFQVEPWGGIEGPVLLIDDIVDSGWTMTIVAALLRKSGSGAVFPFALAKMIG